MNSAAALAHALATVFLFEELEVTGLEKRGHELLGRHWRWLPPLARRIVQFFGEGSRPRHILLRRFLLNDPGFLRAYHKHRPAIASLMSAPPRFCPVESAALWKLPRLRTPGELADWLDVPIRQLDWFADRRRLEAKQQPGPLQHYRYRALTKRFGRLRLIEAPKSRTKAIQRRILTGILDAIPPHDAAHGFRKGRSIKSFAAPHTGKRIVLKIDLHNFFPSVRAAQVRSLFHTVGFPEEVADLLTGLCTNATPDHVWPERASSSRDSDIESIRRLYRRPHLPQGAPTSPALANLCAFRLDCRLAGLARAANAAYTRYADDLAFSGDDTFARVARRFLVHATAVVMDEGFSVYHRKTRLMRQGVRQQLTGLVVNERTNIRRVDFDRLKAILTNCIRFGPASQNRNRRPDFRLHLAGRVCYVEMVHPTRGARLRELLEQIEWT